MVLLKGVHPRIITEGLELAKEKALSVLDSIKCDFKINRERLIDVARTSLATKVHQKLADQLTDVVVDAILAVKRDEEPINLHMVEIMEMQHKLDCDTRLVATFWFCGLSICSLIARLGLNSLSGHIYASLLDVL